MNCRKWKLTTTGQEICHRDRNELGDIQRETLVRVNGISKKQVRSMSYMSRKTKTFGKKKNVVKTMNLNPGRILKSPVKIKIYLDAQLWAFTIQVQELLNLNSHLCESNTQIYPFLVHVFPLNSIPSIQLPIWHFFGCLKDIFRFLCLHPNHALPLYQKLLGFFQYSLA